MPQPSQIRLALVLTVTALVAVAAPAQASDRGAASTAALSALGSASGSDPVVVFGLPQALRTGTRISEKRSGFALTVRGERAFFFYEDSAHSGRVALVGARSGHVTLSRTIRHAPLVNGRLPVFLTSAKRYRSAKYRVFSRAGSTSAPAAFGTVLTGDLFAPDWSLAPQTSVAGNTHPKADQLDATAKQNHPKHLVLTGSDDDGDMLLFTITKQPRHGTLSDAPPNVTYTPDSGYLGKDLFTFKTSDGELDSNTARVLLNVVPAGAAPVTTTSGGCTAYTEQDPAVTVDNLVTVSDADDTTLDSATVKISGDFAEGDVLLFTDQNGISGSYDDETGVLALSGTATVASYQAALRTVRYRNLSGGNPPPTKTIGFSVNDAGNDSAPASKQICISGGGGSARPIGEASEGALQYTEDDGALPVDAGFTLLDNDSADLTGATIRFSPTAAGEDDELGGPSGTPEFNYFPDQDVLGFADTDSITGSFDTETGVLTLSGTASVADYEAALRSVTYTNTSQDPNEASRTIKFQVTDSSAATSVASSRGVLVTAVNDAPELATSEGSTPATGADPSVTVDDALTVGDVDDTDLESATVRITSGFAAGDVLSFSDQLGISGSYDSDTGVLTLTGTAPVADYETALRSVGYSHPDGNPPGTKTVEFVVNDGDLDSVPATKDGGTTAPPALDTTDTALSYTAGDGSVAIDPGIAASDADSTTLGGATVQVTGNWSPSEDKLAFTDQLGITGFYDDETGVLSLSGTAPIADYETALRSVTYENSSATPSTDTRTVTFHADDGEASNNVSDAATRDIEVRLPDQAPVVTSSDGSTTYTTDGADVAVDSAVAVTDADDTDLESAVVRIASGFEAGDSLAFTDQLGISGTYDPDTGVLTLTGTAPVADYETALRSIEFGHTGPAPTGPKTVEFVVNDGELDSAAGTKTIDIAPAQ